MIEDDREDYKALLSGTGLTGEYDSCHGDAGGERFLRTAIKRGDALLWIVGTEFCRGPG